MLVCNCRLPLNDIMRPFSSELMSTALQVLSEDNEENGLLCLRISFELHKQYRPALEDFVPKFLDLVRKVRTTLCVPAPCASFQAFWLAAAGECSLVCWRQQSSSKCHAAMFTTMVGFMAWSQQHFP